MDHVNGLPYLLSRVKVDTVILPYIHPIERLLIAAIQPPMPPWYYLFMASPAAFLVSMGVRNSYFLGEGRGEGAPPDFPRGPPSPRDIPPEEFEPKIEWYGVSEGPPENLHPLDEEDCKKLTNTWNVNINFIRAEGHAIYGHAFMHHLAFTPFVKSVDQSRLEQFCNCLKENGVIRDPYNIRSQDLVNALRDREKLERIRECYRENVSRHLNLTSLAFGVTTAWLIEGGESVMVLRPPSKWLKEILPWGLIIIWNRHMYWPVHKRLPFYILSTGDLRLDIHNVRQEFIKRYISIVPAILAKKNSSLPIIFQAPHHGSTRGFNETAENEFKNWLHGEIFASVVSCGHSDEVSALNVLKRISLNAEICHQRSLPVHITIHVYD